ncbi:MAG: methyltransferase type 12 [Actinomycetota bacterium]|nr:methyltransferase type 12 [Actinomycetota bacterium]
MLIPVLNPLFIENARSIMDPAWPISFEIHDFVQAALPHQYSAVYALDVLEHIEPRDEFDFLSNLVASLVDDGIAVIGMPSIESQPHANPASRDGHVNCKSGPDLKECLRTHFQQVFVFSTNDEVIHTGYPPMAHYLLALCVGPIRTCWPVLPGL